jgi:L-histidine Nalpha-methyltransferase
MELTTTLPTRPPPLASAHPPQLRFLQAGAPSGNDPLHELSQGLLRPQAEVSPKYLYDALGSALFVAITELPEYYPTRTEAAILSEHGDTIAAATRAALPTGFALVDLGAGDGAKAARLFDRLKPRQYVAVDIAEDFMRGTLGALQQRHPALPMTGVIMDFSASLQLPAGVVDGPSLMFYPGSSIGNFAPSDALRLLREARLASSGGALLIGADMIKPKPLLDAAYHDELGVTGAFNLNLLRHLNLRLGTDFQLADWAHRGEYNSAQSRVEMHLLARRDLTVRWPGHERPFRAGDSIHTENSYKWTPESFEALLRDAGWHSVQRWHDDRAWFGVFLARA